MAKYAIGAYNTNNSKLTRFLFSKKNKGLGEDAKEKDLQDHFYNTFAPLGIVSNETSDQAPGRVDLGLEINGTRFPIEVKAEDRNVSRENIKKKWLSQAEAYAAATTNAGALLVLDTTAKSRRLHLPPIEDYCYVDRLEIPNARSSMCVVVIIIPANRFSPSDFSK